MGVCGAPKNNSINLEFNCMFKGKYKVKIDKEKRLIDALKLLSKEVGVKIEDIKEVKNGNMSLDINKIIRKLGLREGNTLLVIFKSNNDEKVL